MNQSAPTVPAEHVEGVLLPESLRTLLNRREPDAPLELTPLGALDYMTESWEAAEARVAALEHEVLQLKAELYTREKEVQSLEELLRHA